MATVLFLLFVGIIKKNSEKQFTDVYLNRLLWILCDIVKPVTIAWSVVFEGNTKEEGSAYSGFSKEMEKHRLHV